MHIQTNMKKLIYLSFLFTNILFAQQINGVYKSSFSTFVHATNSSKNYSLTTENIIVVDINDLPYTNGSVSVTNHDNQEAVTIKFVVKSDKKYQYEDGNTFLYYDGVISLSGVETKTECTIAFDVDLESLIIVYDGGNTQVWSLDKI